MDDESDNKGGERSMWDEERMKIMGRKLAEQEMDKAGKNYPDRGMAEVIIALETIWQEAVGRANKLREEVKA